MNTTRNNVITASRMNAAMRCLRQHYWQFEVGLRRIEEKSLALWIGSAWARAMEARWNGKDYDAALAYAMPEGVQMDAYTVETVAALLAGYYDYYGKVEDVGHLEPEVQFSEPLIDGFTAKGKLDGLGSHKDNRSMIVESKTTSDSIDAGSQYWLRLAFNMQLHQYIIAARNAGWDIQLVYYDVTRKPQIAPKEVYNLDADGKKIVLDADGKRVFNEKGKSKGEPRQTGDDAKGWVVQSHIETPQEFSERLWRDTLQRPSFYFARREVPVIDAEIDSFRWQRDTIIYLIVSLREFESTKRDPADAWPRNVSEHTCSFCPYQTFCLQNISVSPQNPPQGFSVQPFNPELTNAAAS